MAQDVRKKVLLLAGSKEVSNIDDRRVFQFGKKVSNISCISITYITHTYLEDQKKIMGVHKYDICGSS